MTNKLLWKIYTIWFLRRIVPLILVQIIFIVIFLKLIANQIFFGKVLENAALASDSNLWEFSQYLIGAFFQTHIAVQLSVLFLLGIGALFLRDTGKAVLSYFKTFQK